MNTTKALLSTLVLLVATGSLSAVDINLNVQEIAHVSAQDSTGALADVWGWYDYANSKNYALVCNRGDEDHVLGLRVIDTTDPASPSFVGTLSFGSNPRAYDVKVVRDYVFVASEVEHFVEDPAEIWIYYLPEAVADPGGGPVKVLTLIDNQSDAANGIYPLSNCHNIFLTEDYLFIAEGWPPSDTLWEVAVLKISGDCSPAEPCSLAVWNDYDFDPEVYYLPHDFYARGDTVFIFANRAGVYRVEFDGTYGDIDSWTKIWYDGFRGDVKNATPYDSIYCNNDTLARRPFSHSGWLSDDGQNIFVADEGRGYDVLDCAVAQAPCVRVFDVDDFWDPSDPARDTTISLVNAFDILWDDNSQADYYVTGHDSIDYYAPDSTLCPLGDCVAGSGPDYMTLGIHNPLIRGRLVFNAWYARGLHVLDISDIENIRHVGYYDHETGLNGTWAGEAFGVYPFSPDGYIYVSGGQGFYIYRYGITGTISQDSTLSGDVYIYDTLTVAFNARLDFTAGTNVYMFKDALIKVNGRLVANGTSSDSVKFIVLGGNPQPGDWQGILLSSNAACTLSYCSITMADIGDRLSNEIILDDGTHYATPEEGNQDAYFDITQIVEAWKGGSVTNNGVILFCLPEEAPYFRYSRNGDVPLARVAIYYDH